MTISEYKTALEALDEEEFKAFRGKFGGSYTTRQQYVDEFVHKPEHERRICQLLGLMTQEERVTQASLDSARASVESAKSARWSMVWALVSVIVAIGALVVAAHR